METRLAWIGAIALIYAFAAGMKLLDDNNEKWYQIVGCAIWYVLPIAFIIYALARNYLFAPFNILHGGN